jgi:hypothetical protein
MARKSKKVSVEDSRFMNFFAFLIFIALILVIAFFLIGVNSSQCSIDKNTKQMVEQLLSSTSGDTVKLDSQGYKVCEGTSCYCHLEGIACQKSGIFAYTLCFPIIYKYFSNRAINPQATFKDIKMDVYPIQYISSSTTQTNSPQVIVNSTCCNITHCERFCATREQLQYNKA